MRIDNDDSAYRLVDPVDRTALAETAAPVDGPALAFTAALSDTVVAVARQDGSLALFETATGGEGAVTILPGHPNRDVRSVAIAADGGRMVTAANDGSVRLWDLARRSLIAEAAGPAAAARNAAAIADDGAHVAVAFGALSDSHFVSFWKAPRGRDDLLADAERLVPGMLSPEQRRELFIDAD